MAWADMHDWLKETSRNPSGKVENLVRTCYKTICHTQRILCSTQESSVLPNRRMPRRKPRRTPRHVAERVSRSPCATEQKPAETNKNPSRPSLAVSAQFSSVFGQKSSRSTPPHLRRSHDRSRGVDVSTPTSSWTDCSAMRCPCFELRSRRRFRFRSGRGENQFGFGAEGVGFGGSRVGPRRL